MGVSDAAHSLTESLGLSPGQAKRLEELLDNYLRSLEQGQHPDREEIIRDNPDLADALDANLTKLDALHGALLNLSDSQIPFEDFFLGEFPEARNLGDFRLLREIGRGGMGVVYEAEQLSLGRPVAVKVLPFAAVLDQRQLRRFKSEAQAAALLRHPNIVGVLAVGCERGVHYYAMELVEGWSLAQVIEHLRRQPNDAMGDRGTRVEGSREADTKPETPVPPQRNPDVHSGPSHLPTSEPPVSPAADTAPIASLSTEYSREKHEFYRSVARLGIQAALALEYAHEEGVVHRDIKPSNLLMDTQGKLWITDFGLAQVHDTHNLTMTGDVVGTLRYMSPEQAAGRKLLDNRTDVYSLGITLYELLTLRPAFPGDNRQELLRRISAEPPSPRKLDAAVPRDLETILLKAISKDPAARYDTAAELAEDLQRFLDQKPIQARRSRPLHQLWRLAKRNPAFTGFAAITVLLLVLGAVVGWAMAVRQSALVDEMDEIRAASERSRRDLQQRIDRALQQTVFALASMQPHERALLEDMCDYYHSLLEERGNDPNIRYEVATGLYRYGWVYHRTDQPTRGHELAQESLDILLGLESEYPSEQRYPYELARTHHALAKPRITGVERAFGHYRRSIELFEELVSKHRDEPKYARQLSYCRGTYGADLRDAGRIGEAEEQTQLAVALSQELVNEFGDQEDFGRLGWSTYRLFTLHMFCHRFDEAERAANAGLAVEDRVDSSFWLRNPENMAGRAAYHNALARLLMCRQRPQHAELHLRQAIAYGDELARAYPHFNWALEGLASAHQLLGDLLLCLERGPEARDAMNDSLRRWQELNDAVAGQADFQESMAWAHYKLGELLWWTGRKNEARVNFIEARTRFETLPTKHRDDLLCGSKCDSFLARILIVCPDWQVRDPRRGIVLAQQGLKLEVGASWQLLGAAYYRNGEWQQAIDALTRCAELSQGGDAIDWLLLAMAHWQLEQQAKALHWYKHARDAIDGTRPLSLQNFSHPFHLRELLKEAESLMEIEHAT